METNYCEPLIDYIQKSVKLTDEESAAIKKQCKEVVFPKGGFITQEGNYSRYAYFIVSGQARSYYIDDQGKTTTWLFHFNEPFSSPKNLFVADYKSFLTNGPGTLTIEALTDVTVIQWSFSDFEFLLEHVPVFGTWIRKLNESLFINIYDRTLTLMTMSAQQRYERMLNDEPHLCQMFSNYYVASYLSLAPQSLSRIKGAVNQGHLAMAV
ncbi:Crp/Fnr family transcriptional regulator [Mucilaginibacter sp.]|jgi:CRP-like cAMP-binding protein|uniref:Crp/Fnr family transcriptional regulator n=1 Tax=Mucilaginibacter sp. TaxID=1882438 RepID=UPI003567FFB0